MKNEKSAAVRHRLSHTLAAHNWTSLNIVPGTSLNIVPGTRLGCVFTPIPPCLMWSRSGNEGAAVLNLYEFLYKNLWAARIPHSQP